MILSIDQGTTGTTVMLFSESGEVISRSYSEFSQIYPQQAWVEHDPTEIWTVTLETIKAAIRQAGIEGEQIKAIGITNQRETTVLWDKATGKPVHNAIVWQCRRSSQICDNIKAEGKGDWIRQKTGLLVDAYFSATKIRWVFNQFPEIAQRAKNNEIAFGTIDTWLLWNLTNGQSHITDHTNASRTLLYNIHEQNWDSQLLDYFDIPSAILPDIAPSANLFGHTEPGLLCESSIGIYGMAGDQQAALFGQGCVNPGEVKNTYGTGCFMLMNLGEQAVDSQNGLLTTIACGHDGRPVYALEGSVFMAGACVQWLRDEMQMIERASETQTIAEQLADCEGVYVVPAFTGLGAPHWDMSARAAILGLTRGTGRKHVIRATLEAIAYQVTDVLRLMEQESDTNISVLKVDGGACANDFLMQFQADMLDMEIVRPKMVDSTALGAALLAGIGCGLWQAGQWPESLSVVERRFRSKMEHPKREKFYSGWSKAVETIKQH